ncbi:MAG: aminoacyl-tRNA hydrolase [Chloroflexota bacterium]
MLTPPSPYIVLGLGNPGDQYAAHRHNVGAQCVNLIAKRVNAQLKETWGPSRAAAVSVGGLPVVLARTRTFMNHSGEAAAALLHRVRAKPDHLLVLYDELDLPLGTIRIRARGSTGGHNGMRSIVEHTGSQDFPRIRIGIGRPYPHSERSARGREEVERDVLRWVLSPFSEAETPAIQEVRARVADAVECIVTEGVEAAMNRFNQTGKSAGEPADSGD